MFCAFSDNQHIFPLGFLYSGNSVFKYTSVCQGTNKNKYKLMCCRATNDEDSKWNWTFVNYNNPQCPSPTAFSNILRNTSSLLKPITDTFSNLIVIITSAISAAVVGIWWLISKFLLKK